jgi:alpha/beta superfamily hydrolase
MNTRRHLAVYAALLVLAASCSNTDEAATTTTTVDTEDTAEVETTAASETTNPTETTTAPFTRLIDLVAEPSAWEDVTITTADDVELYARYWPGGTTALLVGHDYSVTTDGAFGQRPDQSSESILNFTATFAQQGYTVLSPDFRGHGQSGGEFEPQAGVTDLAAAYSFLAEAGYDKIVMVGWVGSGTTAVVLDAAEDNIAFDGIAMLFSPPQDHGMDANAVLADLEAPTFYIGSNAGTSASWARRMSNKASNSAGAFVFERVPTGLTFTDVFGPEFVGRILDFADSV